MVEQGSVQQNFVRSRKVEQTVGQELSRTRTSIFTKSASNFQLRKICSTFLVDLFKIVYKPDVIYFCTHSRSGHKLVAITEFDLTLQCLLSQHIIYNRLAIK